MGRDNLKLETFFDNFELLADAPNGVQKFRELILQLAVQGKLVPQDPNDEPASVLLEKIKAEKERLIKEKKIQKPKPLPGIEIEELPFELPNRWQAARLGHIYEFSYGKSLPKKARNEKSQVPVYGSNGIIGYHDEALVTEPSLIAGRKGSSGAVNFVEEPFWSIDTTYYITPPKGINLIFSYYLFRSLDLKRFDKSTAIPGLNRQDAYVLLVGIPPQEEQKRIVAKVDQLMALCDELEVRQQKRREGCVRINNGAIAQLLTTHEPEAFTQHWQRIYDNFDLLYSIPENISKLRQAILQLAVQGKLVPQDPNDEPASVLLEKIKAEKERLIREKKAKKDKILLSTELDEVPFDSLPNLWTWIKLGQILKSIRYGTSKNCSYEPNGIPVLRIPNLVNGSIKKEDLKFTTLSAQELQELRLVQDDLLMVRSNGSKSLLGRTAVVKSAVDGYAYAGYLVRLRVFLKYVYPEYLHLALDTHYVREQIEIPIRTTSGVKNINSTEIANLILPLPPYKEQKRIVAKVDQLMALCDELEAKLIQAQTNSEKLIDAAVRQVIM